MAKAEVKPPDPWQNQWAQPQIDVLIEPLKDTVRECFGTVMEQAQALEGVERRLTWYGPAWNWTIELVQTGPGGREMGRLAYIVPNPETPTISIGLADGFMQSLGRKRLSKYVREGLRSAKCAVELHWTWWLPGSRAETEHLVDLITRYHKWMLEDTTADSQ